MEQRFEDQQNQVINALSSSVRNFKRNMPNDSVSDRYQARLLSKKKQLAIKLMKAKARDSEELKISHTIKNAFKLLESDCSEIVKGTAELYQTCLGISPTFRGCEMIFAFPVDDGQPHQLAKYSTWVFDLKHKVSYFMASNLTILRALQKGNLQRQHEVIKREFFFSSAFPQGICYYEFSQPAGAAVLTVKLVRISKDGEIEVLDVTVGYLDVVPNVVVTSNKIFFIGSSVDASFKLISEASTVAPTVFKQKETLSLQLERYGQQFTVSADEKKIFVLFGTDSNGALQPTIEVIDLETEMVSVLNFQL